MLKFPSRLPGVSTTVRGGNVSSPNQVPAAVSTSRVPAVPPPETLKGKFGNAGPEPNRRQPTEDLPTPVFPISMTTFSSPMRMTVTTTVPAPTRASARINFEACRAQTALVPTARNPKVRTCHVDFVVGSAPCDGLCTRKTTFQDSTNLGLVTVRENALGRSLEGIHTRPN